MNTILVFRSITTNINSVSYSYRLQDLDEWFWVLCVLMIHQAIVAVV